MMLSVATASASSPAGSGQRTEVAFLLAQLGAHAAELFGQRAASLELSRPQAGLLRLIGRGPGQSQQAIAGQLGMPPSRLVGLVDGLEQRGLVERRRSQTDRRNYALHLTSAGETALTALSKVAAEHEATICAPLSAAERTRLGELLGKLAAGHGLAPGIHPGYRHLGADPQTTSTSGE
jgi:DNA-binding MarR family transcriptional regulator